MRKVSGTMKPSAANTAAFDAAVEAIAQETEHLLTHLVTHAPPKDRAVEAEKAKEGVGLGPLVQHGPDPSWSGPTSTVLVPCGDGRSWLRLLGFRW